MTSQLPSPPPDVTVSPYAELHCHSYFSFQRGVSSPEELVTEAAQLQISTLALTDYNGLYGAVRFATAARKASIRTVYGASLTVSGMSDNDSNRDLQLLVLARNHAGYMALSHALTDAQLAGEKGRPVYRDGYAGLSAYANDNWVVVTGSRNTTVGNALNHSAFHARHAVNELIAAFGARNVAIELVDHADPYDSVRNGRLYQLADQCGVRSIATNAVLYAKPRQHRLANVVAAIRSGTTLDALDALFPVSPAAHLRSGVEQATHFRRYPQLIADTAAFGSSLAFDLRLLAPELPRNTFTDAAEATHKLREAVYRQAPGFYGQQANNPAWQRLAYELSIITELGYAGYFLIMYDIVLFCRRHNIFCQGRGSAATSAVCYVLGITNADAVALNLLFERFLSPERDGPPDIDLDIEAKRRDEVIQYVYARYGRTYAAQVATVITYRSRSALRDTAKAFGFTDEHVNRWVSQISARKALAPNNDTTAVDALIPRQVRAIATELLDVPQHLGIHSGGMVLSHRPLADVCPIEHARRDGRTVLQWDKDDCAAVGLVKFDLLGLGMLSALRDTLTLIRTHHQRDLTLATLPLEDPAVYDMLCIGDAIGVFQVESRAQLSTLPRMKPRTFYDLVIEVALIRPGPIQGGSVHPYLRRRSGKEAVTYLHPLLEPVLKRTLGVPLFQEQLMQMAISAAGFSPTQADQLRQAMSAKRSSQRMEQLRQRLYDGMHERGITGATADKIYIQIAAFAGYGFPESHAISFAHLVYASAWLKHHYPAAFLCALLNNQPMGFYTPASLVADARRHGVLVKPVDVNYSAGAVTLEACPNASGGVAVRFGLAALRHVGMTMAERITDHKPYRNVAELVTKTAPTKEALQSLAAAGALDSLGLTRREAIWGSRIASFATAERLPGIVDNVATPRLAPMSALQQVAADLFYSGTTTGAHPIAFLRTDLQRQDVVAIHDLLQTNAGRVTVAGLITHRQQPPTANGVVFLNLEDETGMLNVICSPAVWQEWAVIARQSNAQCITGRLRYTDTVPHLQAESFTPLTLPYIPKSRDYSVS
ncbi:MAG: error-prone DNA polymerase [Nitriliruptoraceae bacterium]